MFCVSKERASTMTRDVFLLLPVPAGGADNVMGGTDEAQAERSSRSNHQAVNRGRGCASRIRSRADMLQRLDEQRGKLHLTLLKLEAEAEALMREREAVHKERVWLQCLKERHVRRQQRRHISPPTSPHPHQQPAEVADDQEKPLTSESQPGRSSIVELNVGGMLMTVHRSTLCQLPGSTLEAMFSSRSSRSSLELDSQGRFFLDFNPHCFFLLVEALRSLRLAIARENCVGAAVPVVTLAGVDPNLHDYMRCFVDYLGLDPIVFIEHNPESYVGKRVHVFWTRYSKYFPGIISAYDNTTKEHEVKYDDGDVRRYRLHTLDFRFEKPSICWVQESNAHPAFLPRNSCSQTRVAQSSCSGRTSSTALYTSSQCLSKSKSAYRSTPLSSPQVVNERQEDE